MSHRIVPWLLGAASLGGCAQEELPRTQLLVQVEAGAAVSSSLTYVRAFLYPVDAVDERAWSQDLHFAVEPGRAERFPLSFGIAPGDADRFKLVIKGYASPAVDAPAVVEQKAVTGFVPDQKVQISLTLSDACHQRPCDGLATTCAAGACVPVPVLGLAPGPDAPAALPDAGVSVGAAFDAGAPVSTNAAVVTPDAGAPASAADRLQAQCDQGDLGACTSLGYLYDTGDGVPRDHVRALALHKRACDGDFARGCANLGLSYYDGEGTEVDRAQAITLFRKACNLGSGRGCTNLGYQYDHGIVVTMDKPFARELYDRGCTLGEATACMNLGLMHLRGEGGPADRTRAKDYLTRACDGGERTACAQLDVQGLR